MDFANLINACLDDLSSVPSKHKIILLNALVASLDMFAAIKTRNVSFVHTAPWYNDNLRSKKVECRKLERK